MPSKTDKLESINRHLENLGTAVRCSAARLQLDAVAVGLLRAATLVEGRKSKAKLPAYNIALDEAVTFIMAEVERTLDEVDRNA
jgi:hypothetical protein